MKVINKPVSVMALFPRDGIPKPLRFSIVEDEEVHEVKRIKIKRIFEVTENKQRIIVYPCQGQVNNRIIHFELRFIVKTHSWILYKI